MTIMDPAHDMFRSEGRIAAAVFKALFWLALILAPAAYLLVPVVFKF